MVLRRLKFTDIIRIGVLLLSTSCSVFTGPERVNDRVHSIATTVNCQLSPTDCAAVNYAIAHLENSTSSMCQQRGSAARARYDAFGYGYRYGEGPANPQTAAYDMYTKRTNNPFGPPTDQNTYLNAGGVALLTEVMGGLIAHEEVHHSGTNLDQDPISGEAYQTGFACMM